MPRPRARPIGAAGPGRQDLCPPLPTECAAAPKRHGRAPRRSSRSGRIRDLRPLARGLVKHKISAVPVLGLQGKVLGVIGQTGSWSASPGRRATRPSSGERPGSLPVPRAANCSPSTWTGTTAWPTAPPGPGHAARPGGLGRGPLPPDTGRRRPRDDPAIRAARAETADRDRNLAHAAHIQHGELAGARRLDRSFRGAQHQGHCRYLLFGDVRTLPPCG
jgi:hypothetical protein